MKTRMFVVLFRVAFALCAWSLTAASHAQTAPPTNSVTAASLDNYTINGQLDPTLTLRRGSTYVFQVNASIHPFYIKTNLTTGSGDQYTLGVTGNGATSGTVTFVVPASAPSLLRYHCGNHAGMGGNLNIIDAVPAPTVTIFSITMVGGHILIKSIGATNWTAIPEYNSNLTASVWATVPGYTNSFINNTNTTGFDSQPLDAICGPNVFLRVRNQSN